MAHSPSESPVRAEGDSVARFLADAFSTDHSKIQKQSGGEAQVTIDADSNAEYSFSICFCTRSRPAELENALHSVAASSVRVGQIVVSDDSVDDDTSRLVREKFPEVVYGRGPRTGLSANRNRAVLSATGTHVLFMDDDTALGPEFFTSILKAYAAVPEELRPRTIVSGLESLRGALIEPSDLSFFGYVDQPRTATSTRPLHTAVINSTVFPRPAFGSIQFDDNLVYGSDEVDICTQAIAQGYRFVLCRDAVNEHFHSALHRNEYTSYVQASRVYTTLKRYLYLERSPVKAFAYALLGPAHLLQGETRKSGFAGTKRAFASLKLAASYLQRYAGTAHSKV